MVIFSCLIYPHAVFLKNMMIIIVAITVIIIIIVTGQ